MKISILTTINHPFSGFAIKQIEKEINIYNIIFDSKKFSSRSQTIWNERTLGKIPYLDVQKTNSIKKDFVKSHNGNEMFNLIKKDKIDLLVNIGTPRILSKQIIGAPSIGVMNCHPGILPYYRGCTCVEWALYNEDPVGNTCHIMTEQIDEGPIILTEELDIKKLKNYNEIRIGIYLNSIHLIIRALKLVSEKNILDFKIKNGGKYYKPMDKITFNKMLENIIKQ